MHFRNRLIDHTGEALEWNIHFLQTPNSRDLMFRKRSPQDTRCSVPSAVSVNLLQYCTLVAAVISKTFFIRPTFLHSPTTMFYLPVFTCQSTRPKHTFAQHNEIKKAIIISKATYQNEELKMADLHKTKYLRLFVWQRALLVLVTQICLDLCLEQHKHNIHPTDLCCQTKDFWLCKYTDALFSLLSTTLILSVTG